MDEPVREVSPPDEWCGRFSKKIEEQRRARSEQIAQRRQRLRELEALVTQQFEEVSNQLSLQSEHVQGAGSAAAQREAEASRAVQDAGRQSGEFDRREVELAGRTSQIADRERELVTLRDDIARQFAELAAARQASDQHQTQMLTELSGRLTEIDKRKAQVEAESKQLTERSQEVSRHQQELDQLRAGLEGQSAANAERSDAITRREVELNAASESLRDQQHKHEQQLAEFVRREAELAVRAEKLNHRDQATIRQRRHLAQQLRTRHKELEQERTQQRAEALAASAGQDLQLQVRLAELQGKYDQLREEATERRDERDQTAQRIANLEADLAARNTENKQQQTALARAQKREESLESERKQMLAELQRRQQESSHELEAARVELAHKSEEARQSATDLSRLTREHTAWQQKREELEAELLAARNADKQPDNSAELTRLRAENRRLETSLAEAEAQAKQSAAGSGGGGQEMDDLRRRFELAVQDVRELKTKNSALTEQLSRSRQAGGTPVSAGGQDWESLKKRMLEQLESDFDDNDASHNGDRLTVQGAIKITDQVVADKERELEELRQMLQSQSQQVGEVAVGAAAVAQMLDTDELVRQERETLKRLQDGLRDQLRKAEIDISLERAKLAREKADVEEKARVFASEMANATSPTAAESEKGKKGRNWLNRLGLSEGKQE